MGSERADIVPRHPQAVVVICGGGGIGLGRRVADPRIEQAAVDQWEQVIVEPTHSVVQWGIGLSWKVAFDAAEQLKHKGATVGRQSRVGAVEQSAGQVGCEGYKWLEGLWNKREERDKHLMHHIH